MKFEEHVKYGGVASLISWAFWGPWNALLFWAASVLIDFDHYIDYVYRNGGTDWHVSSIFRLDRFLRQKLFRGELQGRVVCLSIFHTAEVFGLIYGIYRWTGSIFWIVVFSGMLFHLFLDLIFMYGCRALTLRAYSLIEYFIRRRVMAEQGKDPDEV